MVISPHTAEIFRREWAGISRGSGFSCWRPLAQVRNELGDSTPLGTVAAEMTRVLEDLIREQLLVVCDMPTDGRLVPRVGDVRPQLESVRNELRVLHRWPLIGEGAFFVDPRAMIPSRPRGLPTPLNPVDLTSTLAWWRQCIEFEGYQDIGFMIEDLRPGIGNAYPPGTIRRLVLYLLRELLSDGTFLLADGVVGHPKWTGTPEAQVRRLESTWPPDSDWLVPLTASVAKAQWMVTVFPH